MEPDLEQSEGINSANAKKNQNECFFWPFIKRNVLIRNKRKYNICIAIVNVFNIKLYFELKFSFGL